MESAAASAFLKSVMGRLFLVLEKEYNKHKGLAKETQSIQQDLRMIAAAMDDQLRALGPNDRTAVARLYSEEMLDLAHDIEDCVDRFMHRLRCKQRSGGGGGAGALVHRVAHELKKVQNRSSFADEIQKLKRRLREAHQRVIDGGAISCGGQPGGLSSTAAYSKPSHVARNRPVGFEKPVEELLSLLDEVDGEPEQLRVISVVGFGGLGKTTLARAVFDSPQTKAKFDCRAWIAATGDSPKTRDGMRGILRDILQQVRPRDTMDVDSQHLEASLKEYLNDKRYLFVIDDIRLDEWSTVNSAFEDNSTSSRIILTTTIQSVANMCSHGNGYVYQMDTLGEEDSKKIAFPGVRSPELEQGSAALLGKCDGLPLALVSVSDYLKSSSEPTGELCAKLCRNLGSHLEEKHHGHDNFSDLRKVLLGNYDSLSGYALTCLLYLGIFPNNRPLKRKVVIRRWLAEGYARSDSLRSEQDIAEENFDKLIDKNIIHPVDTRNNSQAKTFKTHGIMHEFVRHKSLYQRFIGTPSPDHPRPVIDANNARHLSIHGGELAECMESGVDLSRVRSLTVFGDADGVISYVHKCKLMRVLDLEECNVLLDHDLKHICRLWHLKYLSLGGTVSELPRCIEGLHCLGTLDLRRTRIKSLPIEVIQLPHLTQLFGKFMLDKDDLKNVNKMSKLQRFLSGKKSNLQTLAGFVTDDRNGFLQIMGDMNKLRKVKIWCRPAANSSNYIDDLSMAIQQFNKVSIDRDSDRSLSLVSEEPSENFLNSLVLEPCPEGFKYDLRSLKLHGKLPRLPPFVALLSGLTELCISSDTLTRDLLSAVVNLSRLLYLKLIADRLEHLEIKHGEFPSLRRLCFAVQSLTSAPPTIEQGALQNIVSLQLLCGGPIVLSGIKIRNFKYLKEITIDSKATAETRQHWEGSAKNHPNRPRVLLLETADPMESEELGPCAMTEKRKRSVDQPSSDGGLDSSLKKMRLSEPSFFEVSRDHPSAGGNGRNVIMQYSSSSTH